MVVNVIMSDHVTFQMEGAVRWQYAFLTREVSCVSVDRVIREMVLVQLVAYQEVGVEVDRVQ